ncbi:RING-H2 finger protein ATL1-like [Panicum miliaceum]|uniref:RING-type E3 ubiquitin transferase n=1 Tax=Panicum miliaceum TaxID=4540 RepID=A0A3L6RHV2_PANMI|nr:RING-H2 finger protein ATL1-like [Panicum miliaceum]
MDASSFPILSVSIVGILSIALLLLAYYLFLTRCGLLFFWRPDDLHLQLQQDYRISVSVQDQQPHRYRYPPRRGLEEAAIRRIPTFRYPAPPVVVLLPELEEVKKTAASSTDQCAVCLADFRRGERLRMLPHCRHAFHIDCIDAWLQDAANCPICRAPAAIDQLHPTSYNYHLLHIPRDIITTCPSSPADAAEAQQPARSSSSFLPLPMRRSLSMDSSTDKRFYLALQRILQQQHSGTPEEEEDGKGDDTDGRSSRMLRRSFFSFSQSRGSRSAILPL